MTAPIRRLGDFRVFARPFGPSENAEIASRAFAAVLAANHRPTGMNRGGGVCIRARSSGRQTAPSTTLCSSPVYPVLKRSDERHVTMQAYDRPVFVEDLARGVAVRLQADPRVKWFLVKALNQESIHSHNAFAVIEWARPGSWGWQNE